MTRREILGISLAITLFVLACGTLPTVATAPQNTPQATQTDFPAFTAETHPTMTRTPVLLPVAGCWNVRSGPSTGSGVERVQCGGKIEVIRWSDNGFVEIVGGYICGQAFGMSAKCQ